MDLKYLLNFKGGEKMKTLKYILGVSFVIGMLLGSSSQELAYDPNDPGGGGKALEISEVEDI